MESISRSSGVQVWKLRRLYKKFFSLYACKAYSEEAQEALDAILQELVEDDELFSVKIALDPSITREDAINNAIHDFSRPIDFPSDEVYAADVDVEEIKLLYKKLVLFYSHGKTIAAGNCLNQLLIQIAGNFSPKVMVFIDRSVPPAMLLTNSVNELYAEANVSLRNEFDSVFM